MPVPRRTRRWIGGLFLAASLAMLILGQTALKAKLQEAAFIRYWLICFAFTGAALLTALIDVVLIKRETRVEQEELLDETLHEIEDAEADEKKRGD